MGLTDGPPGSALADLFPTAVRYTSGSTSPEVARAACAGDSSTA
jgi:hypothetical protein